MSLGQFPERVRIREGFDGLEGGQGPECAILFDPILVHADVARFAASRHKLVSAGFVDIRYDSPVKVHPHGESESLKRYGVLPARLEDEKLIRRALEPA